MKPENRALLGLGLLLFGAAIASDAKTEEGATIGSLMVIGGMACLADDKVLEEIKSKVQTINI